MPSNFEDRDSSNYFYVDTVQSNNIWQIGTPSKTIFNSAKSQPLAFLTDTMNSYPVNNQSSFEFFIFTDDATEISFWHRYDTDSLQDGGIVEVSMDGGLSWYNVVDNNLLGFTFWNFYSSTDTISSINEPGFSGSSGGWIQSSIYYYAMYDYRFRYTFSSDGVDNNREGWMLDNFNFACFGTGIEKVENALECKLYPNPILDQFFIELDTNIDVQIIKIYDTFGHIVSKGKSKSFDSSDWPCGLYLIVIETNQGQITKKIVKG